MKKYIVLAFTVTALAGCVNDDNLSGNVYSSSAAKQVQSVSYGTVINARAVKIQGGDDESVLGAIGGAVIGGFLGNTVGGGSGRQLATAGGALLGGLAGQGAQSTLNSSKGVELEIRKDDGSSIIVVQKQSPNQFPQGQRVTIATRGSTVTVSPRA